MRASLPCPRAGLTLLEVLIVLAIVAITASVVPVARRSMRATPDLDVLQLLQQARREAVRRGETLHLRVDGDGAWVLAAGSDVEAIASGRVTPPLGPATTLAAPAMTVRIDALGTCQPTGSPNSGLEASDFDMLTCRPVAREPGERVGMTP